MSEPKIETVCKNCGHTIKRRKGQWFHRIKEGFVTLLFSRKLQRGCVAGSGSCDCNMPEPERGNLNV